MLHIHNLFSVAREINLFPTPKKTQDAQAATDIFEPPVMLSGEDATRAIENIELILSGLEKCAKNTMKVLSSTNDTRLLECGFDVRNMRRELDALKEKLMNGEDLVKVTIVHLQRRLKKTGQAIRDIHIRAAVESLKTCGARTRASIDAIVVLQALKEKDFETVKEILTLYRPIDARKPNKTESDLLRRFDSKMLTEFAEKDLVIRMPIEFFEEFEQDQEEVPQLKDFLEQVNLQIAEITTELEVVIDATRKAMLLQLLEVKESAKKNISQRIQGLKDQNEELSSAFYLRDHYYLTSNEPTKKMFRHLTALLDEAGIAIASEDTNCAILIRSLLKGYFEQFCYLGFIEKMSYSEVREKVVKKETTFKNFTKIGNEWCRVSESGLEKLRMATLLASRQPRMPRTKKEPVVVEKKVKTEAPLPKRGLGYAIMRLDETVVLK